jgi:hypothetical protein
VEQEAERKVFARETERRAQKIDEAISRHEQIARGLQAVSVQRLAMVREVLSEVDKEGMNPDRAMAAIAQVASKGVAMEREALGLQQKKIFEMHIREARMSFVAVMEKYITSSEVMENVIRDIDEIGKKEIDEIDALYTTEE